MAAVTDDDDFENIHHDDFAIELDDEHGKDARIAELREKIQELRSNLARAQTELFSKDKKICDLKLALANKEEELKIKDVPPPAPVIALADTLLSHKKVARTSSVEIGSRHFACNAFDGAPTTRWASELGKDKQHLYVDLGAQFNISRVEIEWEEAAAKRYEIKVSKGGEGNWNIVWKKFDGYSGMKTVETDLRGQGVTGRFVQMYGIERANKNW